MAVVALKPPPMAVLVTMEFFKHPYYTFNRTLMTLIGQWPDQSTSTRRVCRTILIYFYTTEILSRLRTIYNHSDTGNIIMDALIPIFFQTAGVLHFITFMLNSQTTLQILNRIRTDWQVWAREREVNILHEYTELGKNIIIVFTVTAYSAGILVAMEPTIEKIVDILLKNGTEPGKFIFLIDYYHIDEQKYFFYVSIYFLVMCLVITAPNVIQLIMLISYAQHGTGIFAALRHRLECIGNNDTSGETESASYTLDDRDMVQLAWCIDRHNEAIEFVNLIEAAYTWNYFVSIGFGMILINVLGLQILTQPNNLQVTLTCGGCALFMALCFLIWCSTSQILIDHSISIRDYIYNCKWYRISPRAQKLLQFMTMRCNVPCQLTAGNMLVLSIRNVWLMLKTVVSYFAFVRSTQGL